MGLVPTVAWFSSRAVAPSLDERLQKRHAGGRSGVPHRRPSRAATYRRILPDSRRTRRCDTSFRPSFPKACVSAWESRVPLPLLENAVAR